MWEGDTSPDGSMCEGMRTDGNSHDRHPAEEPHPEGEATEMGEAACLILSLLGTAVSGSPVGASPDADQQALLIASSREVLLREHAHDVRLCFAKGATLFPELKERHVDALALAPPSFLAPHSGTSVPLRLPILVAVRTAAPAASLAATGGAGLIYEVQPAGPVRRFTGTRYDPAPQPRTRHRA